MQDLREIVHTLSGGRVDKIETFNELRKNRDRLYFKFYKGIADGKIKTDEDAIRELYAGKVAGSKYKMMKKRFTERLYTTLLFLQPRENSPKSYTKALYYCYKYFIVARLLAITSPTVVAVKLLEKVIRKATTYEVFELIELSAIHLRREYMLSGDIKKFEYYDNLFVENQQKIYAEALAEKYYNELIIKLANTFAPQPGLAEATHKAVLEINDLRIVYPTYKLNYFYYATKLVYDELMNNYPDALSTCDALEEYLLSTRIFYSQTRHANALVRKVNCYLHLGDYKQGIKCAEKTLTLYRKGIGNWWVLQELYFLLALNVNDFTKAGQLYAEAVSLQSFEILRPRQQEVWQIYGGYLWFIYKYQQRDDLIQKVFKNKPFRISKLVNDLSVYSKDKKGLNIAVLILQILIYIQNEDFDSITDHFEALRTYAYNYLNRGEAFRSYYFVQILMLLVKSDFNPSKMKAKTKSIFQRMQQEKVNYNSTQTRMEVLPYEELWKMILNMLEARDKKGKEKAASFTEAA